MPFLSLLYVCMRTVEKDKGTMFLMWCGKHIVGGERGKSQTAAVTSLRKGFYGCENPRKCQLHYFNSTINLVDTFLLIFAFIKRKIRIKD